MEERRKFMNEQPPETVGQILAFIMIAIALCTFFFSSKPQPKNMDFFKLGYIIDEPVAICNPIIPTAKNKSVVHNTAPKTTKQKTVRAPKPKPKQAKVKTQVSKNQQHTKFQQDCIDVLIKLGFGKREAKSRMHMLLAKYSPTNLQEFIQVAFKREHT
jgi:hypothetical protein